MTARNNTFENNTANKATCIHINKNYKNQNYSDKSSLIKQGDQYDIKDPEIEIMNNTFRKNTANRDCSGVYVKEFNKIIFNQNSFRSNEAQYGTCLYIKQKNEKSITVVKDNRFYNNKARSVC